MDDNARRRRAEATLAELHRLVAWMAPRTPKEQVFLPAETAARFNDALRALAALMPPGWCAPRLIADGHILAQSRTRGILYDAVPWTVIRTALTEAARDLGIAFERPPTK